MFWVKFLIKRSRWWWPAEWRQHVWDKLEKWISLKCEVFVLVWWLLWNTWNVLFCQRNRSNYKTPLTPTPTPQQIRGITATGHSVLVRITVILSFRHCFVDKEETIFLHWNYNAFLCHSFVILRIGFFVILHIYLFLNTSLNWFCCILANGLFFRYVCSYYLTHTIPQSNIQYVRYAIYRST